MPVPGAYLSSSSDHSDQSEQGQLIQTDSDDLDFEPDHDIVFGTGSDLEDDEDEDDELELELIDDDDDEEQDIDMQDNDNGPTAGGQPIRIAFDGKFGLHSPQCSCGDRESDPASQFAVVNRRVLIVDEDGNSTPLTDHHLSGSHYTVTAITSAMLSTLAADGRRSAGAGGGRRRINDDDDDDDDIENDDSDDDEYGAPSWGPPKRRNKQYYDIPTEPQEPGVKLERSGEFGPVSRRVVTSDKTRLTYRRVSAPPAVQRRIAQIQHV